MPGLSYASAPARPGDVSVRLRSGLENRWSPVRFDTTRTVGDDDLTALFEAARWAPSTFGEEPWRFIVATRDDPWRPDVDTALVDGNAWARDAAVLLVGMSKRTFSRNGRENGMAAHDLGIALGGLLAEATSRNLATHPMGGFRGEDLRKAFDVPDDFTLHWVLAIGHYDPTRPDPDLAEKDRRPRRRRPLEETFFGRRFGVSVDFRGRGEEIAAVPRIPSHRKERFCNLSWSGS